MIQSDKKLIIVVVISCILLALLGFAWKQRTSIPFVTVTLEGLRLLLPMALPVY